MLKTVFYLFVFLMSLGVSFAAGESQQGMHNRGTEAVDDWYTYRFVVQDGYRIPQLYYCKKSERQLAEVVEELDRYRVEYEIVEQITEKGKPLVVDLQTVRDNNAVIQIVTDRYVRGEKYCNEVKHSDLSGGFYKKTLDRYR